ncbi:hypothetical protein CAPTEDRAFT_227393 [Capitella teleta]|uniref:Shisa N-terminal domain-containing protein n=1 Tax=Capitella teleta TaxID=283909 RepID=R7TLV2_CAPTE|nr:hypothetical protein CAPTEDRAFT_227393 [Capitella teleta]|eukprot:ELT92085.1 hypothetical protein CAPTEDRAFT_227393 [Capitella teleta]
MSEGVEEKEEGKKEVNRRRAVSHKINREPINQEEIRPQQSCSDRGFLADWSREYCRGFIDKHGQWNNGFSCPKWGSPDDQYCCGDDMDRHCCPPPEHGSRKPDYDVTGSLPVIVGALVATLIMLATISVLMCFFCRCCWAYKRRKRQNHATDCQSHSISTRANAYVMDYSACNHNALPPEFAPLPPCPYPTDDPPPYPGERNDSDDKLPLQRAECFPGNNPVAMTTNVVTRNSQFADPEEPDRLCDLEVEMTNYPRFGYCRNQTPNPQIQQQPTTWRQNRAAAEIDSVEPAIIVRPRTTVSVAV